MIVGTQSLSAVHHVNSLKIEVRTSELWFCHQAWNIEAECSDTFLKLFIGLNTCDWPIRKKNQFQFPPAGPQGHVGSRNRCCIILNCVSATRSHVSQHIWAAGDPHGSSQVWSHVELHVMWALSPHLWGELLIKALLKHVGVQDDIHSQLSDAVCVKFNQTRLFLFVTAWVNLCFYCVQTECMFLLVWFWLSVGLLVEVQKEYSDH